MLELQKLRARNFRSWKLLEFPFKPGLTLLTGSNGDGKTSIRYATQYAISGSIPGLKKQELIRDGVGTNDHFEVTLDLLVDDKPTTIKRTGRTNIVSQNGEQFSVRETNFMDRLVTAMNFAFLSADRAAFVDSQEYKRKEMLNSLIQEVSFLRTQCTPYVKELGSKLADRKIRINAEADSMYMLKDDLEQSLADAIKLVNDEHRRINELRALADEKLPMTSVAYQQAKREIEDIRAEHAKKSKHVSECRAWTKKANAHNTRVHEAASVKDKLTADIRAVDIELEGIDGRVQDAKNAVTCGHCGGEAVCGECGKKIVRNTEHSTKLQTRAENLRARREELTRKLQAHEKNTQDKHEIISNDEIDKISNRVERYEEDLEEMEQALEELRDSVQKYELAESRSREIANVADHQEHLQELEKSVEKIQQRIKHAIYVIKRKKRIVEVIDENTLRLRSVSNIVYETMPAIYYNLFLTKLNEFCQYLLSAVSDMEITLGASQDGITIDVDGKRVQQLSQGERQRVRIATTLAFAMLAPEADTLFIDEVFDHALDADGVDCVSKLISGQLRQFFKNIILISHQPGLAFSIGADNIVHVAKNDSNISKIT